MDKLVSVIIPVFNAERFLDKCLESVCSQTYTNMEIILINDGSKDSSLEICQKWAMQDNRIRVYSKKNEGQGKARNLGIDAASGDCIAFVDSDDYINIHMIECMVNVMNEYQSDMVQCGYQEVQVSQDVDWRSPINYDSSDIFKEKGRQNRLLCYYTEDIIPVNKLIRRECLGEHRFPEGIIYEDKHLMFRLRYYADTIVDLKIPLYYYVQTDNSTMRNSLNEMQLVSSFRVIEELLQFCRENDLEVNYQSELSGDFRKLLSLYFSTKGVPEFKEYNQKALHLLERYLPELRENPFVIGRDKLLLTLLSCNSQLINLIYWINRLRKTNNLRK